MWIAVGRDATNTYSVMTSPDGLAWTLSPTEVFNFPGGTGIGYGGGEWLARGGGSPTSGDYAATTRNGLDWFNSVYLAEPAGFTVRVPSTNLWVSAGSGTQPLWTSPDGIIWSAAGDGDLLINAIAVSPAAVVAVGGGFVAQTANLSTDGGITWTGTFPFGTDIATGIAWCQPLGLFVATVNFGTDGIWTSPDGITWTARSTPMSTATGVATDGRTLVAISGTAVYHSADAATWTAVSPAFAGGETPARIFGGNNLFVLTTSAANVLTSPDGITWTASTPTPFGGGEIAQMAYGTGVAPATRQFPRDDPLALGAPRQTAIRSAPTSRQYSYRQGTTGTYW